MTIKYMREIEYTCGARIVLSAYDLKFLENQAALFETRMCPSCQLKEGDITPDELEIMLANCADELQELLMKEAKLN